VISRHPHGRPRGHKILLKPVGRYQQIVIGIRRRPELVLLYATYIELAAQPFDAPNANLVAMVLQSFCKRSGP